MSDWREDDTDEPKRKKAANKPAASAKKRKSATSSGEAEWREPADATSPPRTTTVGADGSRWQDASEIFDEPVQPGSFKRWLKIGSLSVVTMVMIVLIYTYLSPHPPLAVRVLTSGKNLSPELGAVAFSTARDEWFRTNSNNNVAFEIRDEPGQDSSLASLFEEDWLAKLGDQKKSNRFVTQGPEKKFVPFYISCFVTIRNEHMFLYSQDKNPFGDSETGLPLSILLTKLASAVAEDAKAWIILDVQLPPIMSNICDVGPKWETAARNALDEIDESLRNRVIVTLPCSDYQQNSLSPEHSSSFFGHSLRQILTDSKGRGWFKFNLTFAEFLQILNSRVTNEVANKRYALQQPVTLPQAAIDQIGGMKLLRIGGGSPTDELPNYNKGLLETLKNVRLLYGELASKHRDAYRGDPIGYAIAEQELQRLEQAAIMQSESFDDKRVEDLLLAIRKPRDISFGVSVIEDSTSLKYFSGEDFEEVDREVVKYLALLRSVPSESTAGEATAEAEKKPVPGEHLEGWHRVLYEWRVCVEIAKKPTNEIRPGWFSKENLLTRIANVDMARGTWLEINFLRILAQDIDWDQGKVEVRLVADAIRLFDQVQRLGTTPEPEIAWFLRHQLAPAERAFLKGIDWLLLGNSSNAQVAFNQAELLLNELEPAASELVESINATQEALYLLPHMLKWQLSEYVFASEAQVVESELKKLAGVANLASEFYANLDKLAESPNVDLLKKNVDLLKKLGERLQDNWSPIKNYVVDQVNKPAARDNAETFRHDMLLLSIPLLSIDQRAKIHERMLNFLELQAKQIANTTGPLVNIGEAATLPKSRNPVDAAASFINALNYDQEMWRSILLRDMRFDFPKYAASYLGSEDPEPELELADVIKLRGKLLKHEFPLRIMAFVVGSGPSIGKQLASIDGVHDARLTHWPLAAAWQRRNLASVHQRLWQVERLGEQAWGDRAYTKDTPPADFYFARLAQKYLSVAVPPDLKLEFGVWLNKQGTEIIEQRASSLRQLDPRLVHLLAPPENPQLVGAKLEFRGGQTNEWQAVAGFFLDVLSKRTPGTAWELGPRKENLWTSSASYGASLWEEPSAKPNGKLAIRGNYLWSPPVAWSPPSQVKLVNQLKFARPAVGKATITVMPPTEPLRINVWMLIDCSDSMETTMEWLSENGTLKSGPSFEAVKNSANRILEQFADMHKSREADVRFGLIAFGLTRARGQEEQFQKSLELSNLNEISSAMSATPMHPLEGNWPSDLISCIEKLCGEKDALWPAQWARSNTPLYNAIDYACNKLPAAGDEQAFVYVLGDGVNYTDELPSRSAGQIQDTLIKFKKLRLTFFLFDNHDKWIANLKKDPQLSDQDWGKEINVWKNRHTDGLADLEKMRSSLGQKKFDYRKSEDFDLLFAASLESVPRLKLDIQNATEPRYVLPEGTQLGETVEIGPEFLPSDFEVKIGGGVYETRQADFRLQGGENLRLAAENLQDVQTPPDNNSGRQSSPIGGQLDMNIILNTRLGAKGLTLDLQFWNGERDSKFTRRPGFILAEATDPDNANLPSFLIADYRYAGFKFPEAQSIPIPWRANQPVSLRIWAADDRPEAVQEILLAAHIPKEVRNKGEAFVEYAHKGERIEVSVRYQNLGLPQRNQRVVVSCPWFQEVDRRYYSDHHEEHTFVLPAELQNKEVPLWITTVEALQKSARKPDPDCKEFFFSSFRPAGN